MKYLSIVCMGAVMLGASGCATKNFVRKNVDPVNAKVDQTNQQLGQTNSSLQKTQQSLEADETTLSQTKETATSADARAGDALNKAGQADQKAVDAGNRADQANQSAQQANAGVTDLKNQMASMDDFKKVSETTVNFKFNSDKLDADAKQQLDQMAASGNNYKRYFIAIEGFTDKTGDATYNMNLSKRRADAVMTYLVSQHDIPVYRIQMIGLGEDKPVDQGKGREANAKNRRVEVSVYSADANASPMAQK
ncbi:MAG TPA: OmpA family protein [Bryobacteraceae bacterium]|nr:OmpA family protein [Bryobacteraceae bacterium]